MLQLFKSKKQAAKPLGKPQNNAAGKAAAPRSRAAVASGAAAAVPAETGWIEAVTGTALTVAVQ